MKKSARIKGIVISGMFAAVVFVVTMLHIPTPTGYIHVGDTFIYLAASLMPLPFAAPCASIGAAMSDVASGYSYWAIPTLIIKAGITLFFTSKRDMILCRRNIIAVFAAGIFGLAGYAIAEGFIAGNFFTRLVTLPMDAIQPIASGILYVTLGSALDKMKIKRRFDFFVQTKRIKEEKN